MDYGDRAGVVVAPLSPTAARARSPAAPTVIAAAPATAPPPYAAAVGGDEVGLDAVGAARAAGFKGIGAYDGGSTGVVAAGGGSSGTAALDDDADCLL